MHKYYEMFSVSLCVAFAQEDENRIMKGKSECIQFKAAVRPSGNHRLAGDRP